MKKRNKFVEAHGRQSEMDLAREVMVLTRENKRLKKALDFKNNNIELLNQINANMRATLKVRETYFVALTGVTADPGLGFNRAMLFMRDGDTQQFKGVMAISPDSSRDMHRFYEEVAEKRFDFSFYIEQFYNQNLQVKNKLNTLVSKLAFRMSDDNILCQCMKTRTCQVIANADRKEFKGIEKVYPLLKTQFVVAPIFTKDDILGVIVCDNLFTKKKISSENILSLQTLCDFAASMIISARRYEEAEMMSIVDELTHLFNYRYLEQRLEEEASRGKRYDRHFSVIMIDIDNFKNFNDKNGHLTGNKALMDLAEVIKKSIRKVDVPARYGGEEFIVILPETQKKGAVRAAEKLLDKIRAHKFLGEEKQPNRKFTVSAGIASYPDDGVSTEAILARADNMLYLAKAHGKDRVMA